MIKVSVVIPAYNVEAYIEECVRSVLSQTLEDIELIVVDDGSTDGTSEIIKHYEMMDVRLKYIYQNNRGIGSARNAGWEKARGEFIYFLDSDDMIHPDALEVFYEAAVSQNLDILCGDFFIFYQQGLCLEELDRIRYQDKECQAIVYNPIEFVHTHRKYSAMVWQYFFNKKKLDQLGYRFYEYVFEDCEFSNKTIFLFERIGYIPFVFYYYRQREGAFCYEQVGKHRLIASVKLIESLDEFYQGVLSDSVYHPYFSALVSVELMRTIGYRNQYVRLLDREIDRSIKKNLKHLKLSHKRKYRLVYGLSRISLFWASVLLNRRMSKHERRKRVLLRAPLKNVN